MADPTYDSRQTSGPALGVHDRVRSGNRPVTDATDNYKNYLAVSDPNGNEIHKIFGEGPPSTNYTVAPRGSEYTDITWGMKYQKNGGITSDNWTCVSSIYTTVAVDHSANTPTEAELNAILDTYFSNSATIDWAAVLGAGARVVLYSGTGTPSMWEFISLGTAWFSHELATTG
jgi:hypothetical protein